MPKSIRSIWAITPLFSTNSKHEDIFEIFILIKQHADSVQDWLWKQSNAQGIKNSCEINVTLSCQLQKVT